MKWKFINVPLGVCDTPFGTSRKCTGEAALVGGLFGAAASLYNTSKTNEANEWMNWQTNEANRQINEAQLAWAREQYQQEVAENRFLVDQAYQRELENRSHTEEYNSPKAVAARYRAAGINPYLAMYGGSSMGHAGGSGSIGSLTGQNPHANQPNMIPMQQGSPVLPVDLGFGVNLADAVMASEKNQSDIAALRAKTQLDAIDVFSKANQRGFQNSKLKAETDKIIQDFEFNMRNMGELDRQIKLANDKIFWDQQYQEALTEGVRFANSIAPELHELNKRHIAAQIAVAAAEVAELNARTDLSEQQKKTEEQRTIQEFYNAMDMPKRLHNDNAIRVATYKQVKAGAAKLKQETATERWHTIDAYKHSMKPADRPFKDYVDYAKDALEYTDWNNRRGFFRTR